MVDRSVSSNHGASRWSSRRRMSAAVLLLCAGVACTGDDRGAARDGETPLQSAGPAGPDASPAPPSPPQEVHNPGPEPDGGARPPELSSSWKAIEPGGGTLCAHGTPFRFFVREGTVDRVLIEFRGGGACWTEETCFPGSPYYVQDASGEPFVRSESAARGVRDHTDERNPFRDWHHVYIPSCTGGGHLGNATATFGDGPDAYTVHFKGEPNTRAVLAWVYENYPAPEKAFVAGCSGGGYGSIHWVPYVREHYGPSTRVYQFSDSAAGANQDDFDAFETVWNIESVFPTFISDGGYDDFTPLSRLYEQVGGHFDDLFLSQFNPSHDLEQFKFFQLMGGESPDEWSELMLASIDNIHATTTNFHSLVTEGFYHCVLPYPRFYEVEFDGILLTDWLNDVIEDHPVDNHSCAPGCEPE